MKNIIAMLFALALNSAVFAAVDLSSLAYLHGRSGEGLNAYEQGSFDCGINVDKKLNKLSLIQLNHSLYKVYILGSEVEKLVQTKNEITLESEEIEPLRTYLCGEWLATRNFSVKAVITEKEVKISYRYYCGIVKQTDTFTCKFK